MVPLSLLQFRFLSFQYLMPQLSFLNVTAVFFQVAIYFFIIDVLKNSSLGCWQFLDIWKNLHAQGNRSTLDNYKLVQLVDFTLKDKSFNLKRYLHPYVHSSLVDNSHDMATT